MIFKNSCESAGAVEAEPTSFTKALMLGVICDTVTAQYIN